MQNHVRSCAGVSLVETMVAVAILAVAVLSLARLFTVSAAVLDRASRASTSAILASQKIEELRSRAAALVIPGEGSEHVDARGAIVAGASSGAGYTRRWRLRALAADPDRLRVVDVRVTPGARSGDEAWNGPRPPAGEVTFTTIVAAHDR
jgi:hypothetical protein